MRTARRPSSRPPGTRRGPPRGTHPPSGRKSRGRRRGRSPRIPRATPRAPFPCPTTRSEEHTSELQSRLHLVCRLLLEKKKNTPLGSELELVRGVGEHATRTRERT